MAAVDKSTIQVYRQSWTQQRYKTRVVCNKNKRRTVKEMMRAMTKMSTMMVMMIMMMRVKPTMTTMALLGQANQ